VADRLSALDCAFLQIENETQQMHVGWLMAFDGPAPDYPRFCAHIDARLDALTRYRQRIQPMPLGVARPLWVDDPHFSLAHHLRHTALPRPGDEAQLRALCGRVMGQRLDRDRPLWEMWLVEGLPRRRWAVLSKVHHAMIDGVSGSDVLQLMLDVDPEAPPAGPSSWKPAPAPSRRDLLGSSAAWTARLPAEIARAATRAARSPIESTRAAAARAYGVGQLGRAATHPTSVLNGPLGPHRRWAWARGDLAEVKAVKNATGATVNDVVLAAVTGGFRRYLDGRGETVEDDLLRALVPVSLRLPHEHGQLGNRVTAVLAELPVGLADPLDRLAAVSGQLDHLKRTGAAAGIDAVFSAADFLPVGLMVVGGRVVARTGQRLVNAVTTNIPGPQQPLYLLGHRMREVFPYVPVAEGVRISIGIATYNGRVAFGLTGDDDAVPDLEVLAEATGESLAELVAATR
jgi:WS/DGAT/MGAT family acyltransferase